MRLKVGVIGLGVGEEHISGYRSHEACEVVKICDFNPEVGSFARLKYPEIEFTHEANDILNDPEIDVVSIASYDHLHYNQILTGLRSRKHLFVEKPLVLKEEHAKEVWRLLKNEPHLKISSNLIMRKLDRFTDLRKRIQKGELGKLSYVNAVYHYGRINKITEGWRGASEDYTIVLGGGIHIVDLIMWLTGDRVEEVFACGNKIQTEGSSFKSYDLVTSTLRFKNGLLATFTCNFGGVTPHFHQLEVFGTNESFISHLDGAYLLNRRDVKNGQYNYLIDKPEFQPYEGKIDINTEYKTLNKGSHIKAFINAIVKGSEPEIDKEQIFDSIAVCFAVEKSLKSGQPEQVVYYNT